MALVTSRRAAFPVLVLDDEADMRGSYERLLGRRGYRLIQADSRRDGLAVVQREPLSLFVSDVRLRDAPLPWGGFRGAPKKFARWPM